MNTEKLLAVKEHILQEPYTFSMSSWADLDGFCGTTCCIAGRVASFAGFDPKELRDLTDQRLENMPDGSPPEKLVHTPVAEIAMAIMGITEEQAVELFFLGRWPKDLLERMRSASDRSDEAQIAAEAIDRFIAKYGDVSEMPTEVEESELVCV